MSTSFACNNATFLSGLSPFNWYRNGATFVRAVNEGARLRLGFTGTSFGVSVNVSSLSGYSAGQYPYITYSIDDGAWSTHLLASTDTLISLASGSADAAHIVVVVAGYLEGSSGTSRWDGTMSISVTGVTVDTGKTITSPPALSGGRCIIYDDSTGAGAYPSTTTGANGVNSWPWLACVSLGLNFGNCSFPGQAWTFGLANNVPGLLTSWPDIYSGVSRLSETDPDIVICAMGRNGGGDVSRSQVQGWMEAIRAEWPAAFINMALPIDQVAASSNTFAIADGYNDYVAAHPSDSRVVLVDGGSSARTILLANTSDNVHYNDAGGALLAALYAPLIQGVIPGGNITVGSLNVTSLKIG